MKRIHDFFLWRARITGILLLVLTFGPLSRIDAQKQSETAESLGLGGASRFDAGYSPIVLDRTSIVPGTPFNVKPTMDNLVSGSKTSNSFHKRSIRSSLLPVKVRSPSLSSFLL